MTGAERPEPRRPRPSVDEEDGPVLPRVPDEDRAEAWGDQPATDERDAAWYRRQRPPHYE